MKIKLLALVLLAALQSCTKSAETLVDNEIDSKLRQTIKTKNDSLLQAMVHSDIGVLRQLGSDDFIKFMHAKVSNDMAIWAFRRGALDLNTTTVLHEYYSKHDAENQNTVLESEKDKSTISYINKEKETYVCMLKSKYNNIDDYLITTFYGLVDGQWKLNDVKVGLYGVYDKSAQDYYAMAEEAKEKNHFVDAFIFYDIANNLQEPIGDMMKYENAEEVDMKSELMLKKVKREYVFPKPLEKISTKPEVVSIAPSKNAKGLFPIITYKTNLSVEDNAALTKEYEQVKAEVKKIYTGLNFEQDFIYYRAYNAATEDIRIFEDHKK